MRSTHEYDQALASVRDAIDRGEVTERVSRYLETGDGYPESFTAAEMEAVYTYARLGRWHYFVQGYPSSEEQTR